MKEDLLRNAWPAFMVSLLCVAGVFFLKPLSIIIHNPFDFSASFRGSFFYYLSSAALYLAALFIVLMLLLINEQYKSRIIALFFSIGLLFWLQSTFLAWDYGLLDGRDIDWNSFIYRELVDLLIWVGVILSTQKYHLVVSKNVVTMSVGIIIIQASIAGLAYLDSPLANEKTTPAKNKQVYEIDYEKQFVFSKNKNVFVLVLDAFGDYVIEENLNKHPGLVRYFDGFTRFNNTLGAGGLTLFSVPAYLTGKPYLNKVPFYEYKKKAYSDNGSLLKNLRNQGWNTGFFKSRILGKEQLVPEMLTEIKAVDGKYPSQDDYDLKIIGLYSSVPQSIKRVIYQSFGLRSFWDNKQKSDVVKKDANKRSSQLRPFPENSSDLLFINKMLTDSVVSYDRPTFKYYHLNGVHTPYIIDRQFRKINTDIYEAGLSSLRIAVRFIRILKELGIYDTSQIYIIADHSTYRMTSNEEIVRQKISSEYPKQAAPLFLFKDFNSAGDLRTNGTPLSYLDFPEIVLGLAMKDRATDVSSYIGRFAKEKRFFYIFSNMASSKYFPRIIETQVDGPVNEPGSWSMTGESYLPPMIDDKTNQLTWQDNFSLERPESFFHYVIDGLLSGGTYSRGQSVEFNLPLADEVVGEDVVVTLTLAPVLGEVVIDRKIKVKASNSVTKMLTLTSDQYQDYSFLFPAEYTNKGNIEFVLLNTNSKGKFIASDGTVLYSPGIKLKKLLITKAQPEGQSDLIKLDVGLLEN